MTLACRLFALLMIGSATASGCPAWAQTTNRLPLEREDMPRFEDRLAESRGYWRDYWDWYDRALVPWYASRRGSFYMREPTTSGRIERYPAYFRDYSDAYPAESRFERNSYTYPSSGLAPIPRRWR